MIELEKARLHLAELGLTAAAERLDNCLESAAREQTTYLTFLNELLTEEARARQERNLKTRTKMAHLPYRKTLAEFDFSFQPGIDQQAIKELATMAFANRAENLVFLGPPGVGKTHLAVALAMEALLHGLYTYFVTINYLVEDLHRAYAANRLEKRLSVYLRPKVLIIDEIGYTTLDRTASNLLFQVVSSRYERGSIVLTSNKSFGEWGELLGDSVLATAILDRLLHHSHVINIRGNSYRLKDRIKAGLYETPKQQPLKNAGMGQF